MFLEKGIPTLLLYKNKLSFQNALIISRITLQSTNYGFIDPKANYHLINHLLLIFKNYVYKTRENGSLDLKVLKTSIHKIKILKNK